MLPFSHTPAPAAQPGELDTLLRRVDACVSLYLDAVQPPTGDQAGLAGLFVAHDEARRLVAPDTRQGSSDCMPLYMRGDVARLDWLAERAGLSPLETELLVVALVSELEPRYLRVFGYLQDDLTRRRPSVALALNLVCRTQADFYDGYRSLLPGATLTTLELIHILDDPDDRTAPLVARFLAADQRVVAFLLGIDSCAPELAATVRLETAQLDLGELLVPDKLACHLAQLARPQPGAQFCYLEGPPGVGKCTAAAAVCQARNGKKLLVVDAGRLPADDTHFEQAVRLLRREALLQHAVLYWEAFDALLDDASSRRRALVLREARQDELAFAAGERGWHPSNLPAGLRFGQLVFPRLNHAARAALWARVLAEDGAIHEVDQLAGRMRLNASQIRDAAALARARVASTEGRGRPPAIGELLAAGRAQSAPRLASFARRVAPRYTWDDLVLPEEKMALLRELCDQARYRARVYEEWGFEGKLAHSGLVALFAGPSGTGKTMAASVIAHELGLDLYAIDLSMVVSKYIGETEKHLAALFDEAEAAHAILFFDEADALFGKRSEVQDAHDRYANLEVAYLLQRIETYDGMVILATNLRKNIDNAFIRRMHVIADFPIPGEPERRRIWENLWPAGLPRDSDLDLELVARRFDIPGGNIRNIALGAAFLAAANGGVVHLEHVLHAARREYQKIGKVVPERDFALHPERGPR